MAGEVCVAGGMHGEGLHGKGCVSEGGICGEGMWMVGEGACVVRGMRGRVHVCVAVEMATATDGTHPTGMHSCDCVFYPYFQGFMEGRSLLVVYVFTSPDSPRGPPWNEGHRPKVRHETSVLKVPAQEQHEHSFCSSTTNAFIPYSLYTVRRYRTSLGAPDLRARLG